MLEQIIQGICAALLAWLEGRASKPVTLKDAGTPAALRADWNAYIRQRLQDKRGDPGQPGGRGTRGG